MLKFAILLRASSTFVGWNLAKSRILHQTDLLEPKFEYYYTDHLLNQLNINSNLIKDKNSSQKHTQTSFISKYFHSTLNLSQERNIFVQASFFENCMNSYKSGGAVSVEKIVNLTILTSTFFNCSSVKDGGALFCSTEMIDFNSNCLLHCSSEGNFQGYLINTFVLKFYGNSITQCCTLEKLKSNGCARTVVFNSFLPKIYNSNFSKNKNSGNYPVIEFYTSNINHLAYSNIESNDNSKYSILGASYGSLSIEMSRFYNNSAKYLVTCPPNYILSFFSTSIFLNKISLLCMKNLNTQITSCEVDEQLLSIYKEPLNVKIISEVPSVPNIVLYDCHFNKSYDSNIASYSRSAYGISVILLSIIFVILLGVFLYICIKRKFSNMNINSGFYTDVYFSHFVDKPDFIVT